VSDTRLPCRLPVRRKQQEGVAITDQNADATKRSKQRTIEDLIAELESNPRAFHEPGDPNEVTLTFISRPPKKETDDGVQ